MDPMHNGNKITSAALRIIRTGLVGILPTDKDGAMVLVDKWRLEWAYEKILERQPWYDRDLTVEHVPLEIRCE